MWFKRDTLQDIFIKFRASSKSILLCLHLDLRRIFYYVYLNFLSLSYQYYSYTEENFYIFSVIDPNNLYNLQNTTRVGGVDDVLLDLECIYLNKSQCDIFSA